MSKIRVLVEFKELRSDAIDSAHDYAYDFRSLLTSEGGRICVSDPHINACFKCADTVIMTDDVIIGLVGNKLVGGIKKHTTKYQKLIEFSKNFGGLGIGVWWFEESVNPFNEYTYKKLLTIE